MQRFASLLVMAALAAGCASPESDGDKRSSGAIVTPATGIKGRVTSVHAEGPFVVLSYPVGTLPKLGQRLVVYRRGLKVAELKVTGPNRDTLTVADVVTGQCQVGDEARED